MNKGERELRTMLERHPSVELVHTGRSGYTLVTQGGNRLNLGSLRRVHDIKRIERWCSKN